MIEQGARGFFRGMRRRFDDCHHATVALRARRQAPICLATDLRPGDTVDQQADDGDSHEARRKKAKDNDGCLVADCHAACTSCNILPFIEVRFCSSE